MRIDSLVDRLLEGEDITSILEVVKGERNITYRAKRKRSGGIGSMGLAYIIGQEAGQEAGGEFPEDGLVYY